MRPVSSLSPLHQVTCFAKSMDHRKIQCLLHAAAWPVSLKPSLSTVSHGQGFLMSIPGLPITSCCSTLIPMGTEGRGSGLEKRTLPPGAPLHKSVQGALGPILVQWRGKPFHVTLVFVGKYPQLSGGGEVLLPHPSPSPLDA